MSEWKSMVDEVPEDNAFVIVHGICCGEEFIDGGAFQDGVFHADCGDRLDINEICHWMTIPAAPDIDPVYYTLDGCKVPYSKITDLSVETDPKDDGTYTSVMYVHNFADKHPAITGNGDVYGIMLIAMREMRRWVKQKEPMQPYILEDILRDLLDDKRIAVDENWCLSRKEENPYERI